MKGLNKAVVFCLITLMVVIAICSSGLAAFTSYADDDSFDAASGCDAEIVTEEATDLFTEDSYEERETLYCSTYFYILNGIDSDIPYEISSYPSSDYSDGIYKFGAVNSFDEIVGADLGEEPLDGEIYCDNEILQTLNKVPSLEEIQSIRSDFDPSIHYIQWYVIKNIGSKMHVDGVIRTREIVEPVQDPEEDPISEILDDAGKAYSGSSKASTEVSDEVSSEASASLSSSSEESSAAASTVEKTSEESSTVASTVEKSSEESSAAASTVEKASEGRSAAASTVEKTTEESSAAASTVEKTSEESSTVASTVEKSSEESSAAASTVEKASEESSAAASTVEKSSEESSIAASTVEKASEGSSIAASSMESSSAESSSVDTEDEEPDITIEIETICNNPFVPDDGEAHLVGDGFKIRIVDAKEPETLTEKIYDAFGKFLKSDVITVTASDGNGTTFKYKNREYWVSIDAAYAYVTANDISEKGLTIPFIFDGKTIEPEDIKVGIIDKFSGMISALKNESSIEIRTKQATVNPQNVITIEAGSTVKNDDGNTLTNDSYSIIEGSLKDGHSISKVVFNGSQTGVGESSNEITSVIIVDSEGRDVSSQYIVNCQNGRLVLVDAGDNSASADYEASTVTSGSSDSISESSEPSSSVQGVRMSATSDCSKSVAVRLIIILISVFLGAVICSSFKKRIFLKKVKK
ncbi:hypothetical protein SAMN04487928_12943 [Butyrivibrio proteoclasticus]|uniref:Cell surface protein n=1 Tax=Butyrivibrio proteoclasticus TaxID=43305 RepID=A0A1I5X9L6_9FIRM|nr:hypothetical protein [Butyrivibrio proteoclasticus]SFQ28594.1 hypothetical protein SAMN04487928_12943 [Butyrivibrio proteoclasticus]